MTACAYCCMVVEYCGKKEMRWNIHLIVNEVHV